MQRNSVYILLLCVFGLIVLGMVMLFSTSAFALESHGDMYFFVKRQGFWLGVAVVMAIVAACVDYRFWQRSWWIFLSIAFVFLVLCFVPHIGMKINGSHRWVNLRLMTFQPSEIAKIASLFFLAWWLFDAISLGIFALPITFFLVFVPALGISHYTFPSQGIRTNWLVAHITALLAAYAALGFSLLASVLYLVQERRLKAKIKANGESGWLSLNWLPPLDTLERIAHAMLLFGFPCMTVGLLIGSVLVQETSLGAAYFLDTKVIASFAMWAVYVLLLFVRRTAGLRGRKAAYLSGAVLVFMLAVWAANLVSHVHRFGAP